MLAVNNPYWSYLAITQGNVVFDILGVDVSGNGIGDSRWPSYFFSYSGEHRETERKIKANSGSWLAKDRMRVHGRVE